MSFELSTILQIIGPPLAVYVGIRMDLAAMKVRLDHLERDLYPTKGAHHGNQKTQAR